jgi:hypothetical protein
MGRIIRALAPVWRFSPLSGLTGYAYLADLKPPSRAK